MGQVGGKSEKKMPNKLPKTPALYCLILSYTKRSLIGRGVAGPRGEPGKFYSMCACRKSKWHVMGLTDI
jgi:hypothetical protein